MEHWTLVILATDCRNVDDSCKSAVDCLFTPICQVALLDYWSRSFKNSKLVDDVIIVTNQIHHASMLNWAHTRGISNKNILRIANSSQGYFSDLTALLEWSNAHSKQCGFVILTPDIFLPDTFHIDSVLQKLNSNSDCLMFHKASNVEEISPHMSVVDVDHINHISRISTDLSAGISYNENSSVGLILSAASLHKVESYLCENSIPSKLSIHSFINWLISHHNTSFIGHEISDTIYHIASKKDLLAAIEDREKILTHAISHLPQEVTQRCHARVGLMGNPSDGFFGKTISFSLPNFFAHVVITSHQDNTVDIVPHPIYDRHEFRSLDHLLLSTTLHGYYGGLRLLYATCHSFAKLCHRNGIIIHMQRGFRMTYETNIPQRVGLSGSSAIIIAAFKALLKFYGLTISDIQLTPDTLPQTILDIEKQELGIAAGLQDRVIQTKEGFVHMDFSKEHFNALKTGIYTDLDLRLLPDMYLAYNLDAASDSGGVHSNVRSRFDNGEEDVRQGMTSLALLVDQALVAIHNGDLEKLASLMDQNFALRRSMYGDAVVGAANLRAVGIANMHNLSAKFTGSGGALVCLNRSGAGWLSAEEEDKCVNEMRKEGFNFIRIERFK